MTGAKPLLAITALFTAAAGTQEYQRQEWMKGPNWPTPTFDKVPPKLPALRRPAILIFSKTNGYRDDEQIKTAAAQIQKLVKARGWSAYFTENAAIFNDRQLARFDALVFSSNSGDVFLPAQRKALQDYIEKGGGFVGLHGAGGDARIKWSWYVQKLIGAQFTGHTYSPQFQEGTIRIADRTHPATRHLPAEWRWTEEYYSFSAPPTDANVLARLDETGIIFQPQLVMGEDHPLIWWRCEGRARIFYSSLGHKAETYRDATHLKLIEGAIAWAARKEGKGCD